MVSLFFILCVAVLLSVQVTALSVSRFKISPLLSTTVSDTGPVAASIVSPISKDETFEIDTIKTVADSNAGVKAAANVNVGTTLMVFVVDTSMPGGGRRIAAVKGAISSLLPKTRVAIVSCFGDEAEVTLEPTSSFISASRKLLTMKKSVMGNLGAGLELALKTSEDALTKNYADRIVMAIIADGRAHGLLTGTSDCETEVVDVCDLELMSSATAIQLKTKELNADGLRLSSVIVDTESKVSAGAEWSEEGARLASVTGSDYYHSPSLSDTELLRILSDVKSRQL